MSKIGIVNKNDKVIGSMSIDEAPRQGQIRRIVRIFLFDKKGKLFLQRRSSSKKTFPNTWDQSAGGHVEENESYLEAAKRELNEELGIKKAKLQELIKFYFESDDKDLHLREFSTLYTTTYSGKGLKCDKNETSGGKWFLPKVLDQMIKDNPTDFTQGFLITWEKYKGLKNK